MSFSTAPINLNHKIITLCGSTKFKKEFHEVWERLTLEGNIVFMIAPFWRGESRELSKEVKDLFMNMHLEKISMSDEIFVVDPDGYIGESTRMEIEYATRCNKPVSYLVPPSDVDESSATVNVPV